MTRKAIQFKLKNKTPHGLHKKMVGILYMIPEENEDEDEWFLIPFY